MVTCTVNGHAGYMCKIDSHFGLRFFLFSSVPGASGRGDIALSPAAKAVTQSQGWRKRAWGGGDGGGGGVSGGWVGGGVL